MIDKQRPPKILKKLEEEYPRAHIALHYSDPLQLMVATILSAQSTDAQINKITPALFEKYESVEDFAEADLEELQKDIYSSGFYKSKAKNIKAAAKKIMDEYGGEVPDTMEGLTSLPGIARKTANIILSNAFGKVVGIAVDTHVKRLSRRLGFTEEKDQDKIERDLMELFPRKDWKKINYLLIDHGRAVCRARKPKCPKCAVRGLCPSAALFLEEHYG